MARNISFTVKYWKQDGPNAQGHFDTHEMKNIPDDTADTLAAVVVEDERLLT